MMNGDVTVVAVVHDELVTAAYTVQQVAVTRNIPGNNDWTNIMLDQPHSRHAVCKIYVNKSLSL